MPVLKGYIKATSIDMTLRDMRNILPLLKSLDGKVDDCELDKNKGAFSKKALVCVIQGIYDSADAEYYIGEMLHAFWRGAECEYKKNLPTREYSNLYDNLWFGYEYKDSGELYIAFARRKDSKMTPLRIDQEAIKWQ